VVGRFLEGKLLVERRELEHGRAVLQGAFDTCDRTGWRVSYPEFKGALAAAFLGLGRLNEAFDAVSDAVDAASRPDSQVWYLPELLRLKGEVLLQREASRRAPAVEYYFAQARDMAHEQGALFWELRIAVSVARWRLTQGRGDLARQMLASICDRFTEGFGTSDMVAAKKLLEAQSAR
jgi:predicted ATPase